MNKKVNFKVSIINMMIDVVVVVVVVVVEKKKGVITV